MSGTLAGLFLALMLVVLIVAGWIYYRSRHPEPSSESRFFSISLEPLFVADLEGNFLAVNRAFEAVTGYREAELKRLGYWALVMPEETARLQAMVEALTSDQSIPYTALSIRTRNENVRMLELNAIKDESGVVYCAARDVTEARRRQEILSFQSAMLEIAGRTARIGSWWLYTNSDSGPHWSDHIYDIHEVTRGRPVSLQAALNFYCTPYRDAVQNAVSRCIETGLPFDLEAEITTAKGNHRWVRVIGEAAMDDDEQVYRIQGSTQDITKQKETALKVEELAERLYTTLESITECFLLFDAEWRFTYVNREAEKHLKRPAADLLGKELWEEFPELIGTRFEETYRQAVTSGKSIRLEEYYPPLDMWVELYAYPSSQGLAVYFRSINEHKEWEARLNELVRRLEESNRDLEDFAFVASHDLQEPLRKIQTFAERLTQVENTLPEREQDYVLRMRKAADRMQRLIQDLLAYSRISSGEQQFVRINTTALVGEVLQSMDTLIDESGATISVADLPDLLGDSRMIRQVFQNLISNAIKFCPDDTEPNVQIYCESETDDEWVCCVRDNGIGIDSRYLERIFQPFQRLNSSSEFSGTGIGLAIVQKIMNRHNARLAVSSQPGRGSCFRLHFRHIRNE